MSMIPMPEQGSVTPHAPQSELRLYAGVPWDNSYEHVRLYNSKADLLSHLETWRVSVDSGITNQLAPIRVGSLSVRVPFTEMSMLDLNYLAFRNNTSELYNDWQFCFITGIEWLSENSTRVIFELDIWQNNIYSATLHNCFVERMHIPKSEDTKFSNLLPESFETGEYVQYSESNSDWGDMYLCIYASETRSEQEWVVPTPVISGNIMMCTQLIRDVMTKENLVNDVQTLIEQWTDAGKLDAILAIFTAPAMCVQQYSTGVPVSASKALNIGNPFGGYVPKNNKLYQYPYCFIRVDNNLGESNVYRWEYFNLDTDADAGFTEQCLMCTQPTVTLAPVDYKGSDVNYGESMLYNNFPMSAWASDTYRAWVAQNKGTFILEATNAALNVGQTAASMATADAQGAVQGVQNIVNEVGGLLNQMYQHDIQPPTMHGKVMQEAVNAGLNRMCFTYRLMSIQSEFAKCIDDFWTVYGYPIRRVVQPNYTSRSTWNYIKTVNCNVQGDMELATRARLKQIFDRGVTVWHNDDVGNYSLANN